ncbi:MAG TPA: phosphatidylserine decarboxylase [Elusimicrobiota bacterium]|nr:phosphatidylserine decarboxylase [Elusimicrobiota bacterium]
MRKFRLSPVAYDGWKFIIVGLFLGGLFLFLGAWFAKVVGVLCLLFAGFCVMFFRDADRQIPDTDGILSPGDGTVMEISTVDGEGYGRGKVVRIFLSIFDGHIQRAPVSGTVTALRYMPGIFLDARDPRASFANESNAVDFETSWGKITVKQIAGLIARRIVCWVRRDDFVNAGDRIGLIRFGSQVDLYVPMETEILVKEGDKVLAGLSIIGRHPLAAKLAGSDASSAPDAQKGEKK